MEGRWKERALRSSMGSHTSSSSSDVLSPLSSTETSLPLEDASILVASSGCFSFMRCQASLSLLCCNHESERKVNQCAKGSLAPGMVELGCMKSSTAARGGDRHTPEGELHILCSPSTVKEPIRRLLLQGDCPSVLILSCPVSCTISWSVVQLTTESAKQLF